MIHTNSHQAILGNHTGKGRIRDPKNHESGKSQKFILFGSYVKNITHANSDVDFIVVSHNDIENPRKESVRIRRALRGISMPMDIIVVPEHIWTRFKDQPGMIYREASRKGKVVYES